MADQIVPLTSDPDQQFSVTLDVDAQVLTLTLRVRFSEMAGYWVLTIWDAGALLLDSIPLVCGAYPAANILGQYAYLQIGSAYVLNVSGVAKDSPDEVSLGTDFVLLWSDTPTY